MSEEMVKVDLPDTAKLMKSADASFKVAEVMVIDCDEVAELAGEELRAIVTRKKALNDERLAITRPLDTAKARIMDLFKPVIARLEQAETMLKTSLTDYQQRLRIEQAHKQAALEAAAEAERKRLEEQAAAAAQSGQAEAAEVLRETAAMVVAPAIHLQAAQPAGVSFRAGVEVEVVDLLALVKHIAATPDLEKLLKPDLPAIKAYVKATGRGLPGVRVTEKTTVAARRAA